MDVTKKLELEEFVEKIGKYRGRHTELVTVLIPAEYNVNEVVKQLESEKSTASNIKSRATRNNVIEALEKIIRELKLGPMKYPKGIALYCGNVSDVEGQTDIQFFSLQPPEELRTKIYRCDQTFVIEPIKEILEVRECYGLLVIERKEATIGLLEGTQIKVLQTLTSGVPGKIRAGGQCLSPDTLIMKEDGEIIKIEDLKKGDNLKSFDINSNNLIISKCLNKWSVSKEKYLEIIIKDSHPIICSEDHTFFRKKDKNIEEVLAKNLEIKDELIKYDSDKIFKTNILKIRKINKKINLIDIQTDAKNFFANNILVHNSSQRFHRITEGLAKEFFRRVAEEMKNIFFDMKNLKGILVGGPIPTKEEFLEEGQLVTALKNKVIAVKDIGYADEHGLKLLVEAAQEDLIEEEITKEKKILENFFNMLGKNPEKVTYKYPDVKKALEMGAVDKLILSKKIIKETIKELSEIAKQMSTEIIFVSDETNEGSQFFNLSGIGAILRFVI
jgi:peptide subunit release factor 1 (eRF1)